MPSTPISVTTSGYSVLLYAPPDPNQFIRVLGYSIIASGTVRVGFFSGLVNGNPLSGLMPLIASSGAVATVEGREGWFDCAPGDQLVLWLSDPVGVYGHLRYTICGV